MLRHAAGRELFLQDLYAGANPAYRIKTRVYTEYAWHSLFIRNLLVTPARDELDRLRAGHGHPRPSQLQSRPPKYGIRSETIIACDFVNKLVLIGGTSYAGEMKKSVFTFLNYVLPAQSRDADALLREHRRRRRCGDLLRPLRHRQDDALRIGRSRAGRRRRAWLGR